MNEIEKISELLLKTIADRFDRIQPQEIENFQTSESLAEMLDRFIVLHIRMWKLEDEIGLCQNDEEKGQLKTKIDQCFKVLRPRLTRAINSAFDSYVSKNHFNPTLIENVKIYKGYE